MRNGSATLDTVIDNIQNSIGRAKTLLDEVRAVQPAMAEEWRETAGNIERELAGIQKELQEAVTTAGKTAQQTVKEHPLLILTAAAGVGALVGTLLAGKAR